MNEWVLLGPYAKRVSVFREFQGRDRVISLRSEDGDLTGLVIEDFQIANLTMASGAIAEGWRGQARGGFMASVSVSNETPFPRRVHVS